jgi:type IV pilus assembly protein PilN
MIKINLLPKEARKRVGIWDQIIIITLVVIGTVVGIIIWNSSLNGKIDQLNKSIADTQQRLEELKKVIAEIEEFERQRKALEDKLRVIAKLEKEQQLPVHLLDELYHTLEENMWLRNFSQADMNLSITGIALSNPVVADYNRKLEESPYFSNVDLKYTQRSEIANREVRNFSITATLTPPQEEIPEETSETSE